MKADDSDATPKTVQITIRVPVQWVARADALARRFSRPGTPASRSMALRDALLRGIETLEAEEAPSKASHPPSRGQAPKR
jgi:hypothetical protein